MLKMSSFAFCFPSAGPARQCIYFTRVILAQNSPGLKPVDLEIWKVMQARIYQTKVHDVEVVRQCPIDVWHGLGQNVINDAVDERRKRLRARSRLRQVNGTQSYWQKNRYRSCIVKSKKNINWTLMVK